mmetsp:Transcript_28255/g.28543  ORF Transcript_28255/g.28543 Transcript_28255/m.28543 type:complete len:286 (-) Transcript_28255:32-889(-)
MRIKSFLTFFFFTLQSYDGDSFIHSSPSNILLRRSTLYQRHLSEIKGNQEVNEREIGKPDQPNNNDLSFLSSDLLRLAALSSRGQIGKENISKAKRIIEDLENYRVDETAIDYSLLLGEWELVFADDDITRSSPFFWAFKKATKDLKDPLNASKQWSDSVLAFTDGIPIKSIGECTQMITSDSLRSQVRVQVFPAGSSLMTTTSTWRSTEEPNLLELQVDKTQVLESTISKFLPFLDSNMSFPSGSALELIKPGSSTVYMRVTYLDSNIRICRNEENYVFVFTRK